MYKKYTLGCIVIGILAVSTVLSGCSGNDAQKEKLKKENADLSVEYAELMKNSGAETETKKENEKKDEKEDEVLITDIDAPVTINGSEADVECYNIDGKIYVRLSDVGEYIGFTPYMNDDNSIGIKEKVAQKGSYDYYSENKKIPKFDSVVKSVKNVDYDESTLKITNAQMVYAYEASKSEVEEYENVLLNEGFEYMGSVEQESGVGTVEYDMYQLSHKDTVYVVKMKKDDRVWVAGIDEKIGAVDETKKATEELKESEKPEEEKSDDKKESSSDDKKEDKESEKDESNKQE